MEIVTWNQKIEHKLLVLGIVETVQLCTNKFILDRNTWYYRECSRDVVANKQDCKIVATISNSSRAVTFTLGLTPLGNYKPLCAFRYGLIITTITMVFALNNPRILICY